MPLDLTNTTIVFDLDGTIVDTAPDLLSATNHALGLVGLEPVTIGELHPFIGRGSLAMIEAGLLLSLSREISTQLVVQTMLGTAKQLRDVGLHPVELREAVTSPGGTTIAAIRELESAGVRAAFLNAIQAAMERSRELAAGEP